MTERLIFSPIITSVPIDKVEPLFKETVASLLDQTSEVYGTVDFDVVEFFFQHYFLVWQDITIHWVVKLKWSSKHKIPGGQAHARSAKPVGEMYFRLLELCIQCQGLMGHKATGYPDAADWFSEIWLDDTHSQLVGRVVLLLGVEGGRKDDYLAGLRQTVRALRDDQNPFDPEALPHLHRLVECAIRLAGSSDEFRKNYWKPYIYSLSGLATQLANNSNGYYRKVTVRLEQKKGKTFWCIYESPGRGKGLKLMYSKQVIPETLAPHGL